MFTSALELFKIGIGPSSSHTMGPMVAANEFIQIVADKSIRGASRIQCILKGSLAFTGKGHATDKAVALGLHAYTAKGLANEDTQPILERIWKSTTIDINSVGTLKFSPESDIIFDLKDPLPEHSNGMIFQLLDDSGAVLLEQIYFSIGGGFIHTKEEMQQLVAPVKVREGKACTHQFDSADKLVAIADNLGLSIAEIQRANELCYRNEATLNAELNAIWQTMRACIQRGLDAEGILPGRLKVQRRARALFKQLNAQDYPVNIHEWFTVYAMAVNEENAAGHSVVTAPTNGAAGVVPALLHGYLEHEQGDSKQIHDFILTAAAIGGLIKRNASISGAEVGCQGEVGSAAAMAAAGLCAIKGGSPAQVENAAEIALEHHLGMTCDPVAGLVQVPCIERNAFGAVKAHTAATLALRGTGSHFMPLDNCIAAMKQTGHEMSTKYKETSLGGLAVSITEC